MVVLVDVCASLCKYLGGYFEKGDVLGTRKVLGRFLSFILLRVDLEAHHAQ